MKWLAYILFIFCFGTSSGQTTESNMPDVTNEIIASFVAEGNSRNWNPDITIKGIYFMPKGSFKRYIGTKNDNRAACVAQYPNYLMGRYEPMILVDIDYLEKSETLKAFIFHELGHIFGQPHGIGLMSPQINGSFLTVENLDLLFENIKNTNPDKFYKQIPFNQ